MSKIMAKISGYVFYVVGWITFWLGLWYYESSTLIQNLTYVFGTLNTLTFLLFFVVLVGSFLVLHTHKQYPDEWNVSYLKSLQPMAKTSFWQIFHWINFSLFFIAHCVFAPIGYILLITSLNVFTLYLIKRLIKSDDYLKSMSDNADKELETEWTEIKKNVLMTKTDQ